MQLDMKSVRAVLLWSGLGLAGALVGLVGFETYKVWRADQSTPTILAEARLEAGPPLARELPPEWIEALIAVEDPGFYRHHGVDFTTPGAGQTTITQGLVKRLYFAHFRPGLAKIEQTLIARFVLDHHASKEEQLNLFLGLAYFGQSEHGAVIGFRDAAETYYHRPLADLGTHEFLTLVAMLPAPNSLDPVRHPEANAERTARIERLLAHQCAPRGHDDVWLDACARVQA